MRIFHVATAEDWAAAQQTGRYTTSTRGRSLAEEGFVHACRGDQWQQVRARYYADVTEPLVLLVLDPDLLRSPVVDEAVGDETFPHVYGPLDVDAVVTVIPLADTSAAAAGPSGGGLERSQNAPALEAPPSFSSVFLAEMFHHVLVACVVLVLVVVGALVGLALLPEWGAVLGTLVGLMVGIPVARRLLRRRSAQLDAAGLGSSSTSAAG